MKVMFFYFFMRDGGIEKIFANLANSFHKTGAEVSFALMSASGHHIKALEPNIKIHNLNLQPFNIFHHVVCIFSLACVIRREKTEIVITGQPGANITLILAHFFSFRWFSTRTIISEHAPTLNWLKNRSEHLMIKLALKYSIILLYRFATRIITVSDAIIPELANFAKISTDKIIRIYNPVYDADILHKKSLLPSHPWLDKKNNPVILSVGRLAPQKNFTVLINAFALLHNKFPQAKLLILGDGPEDQMLDKLVENLGLTNHICMPGFEQNPYAYMSKADMFVLSSDFEGLPTVLIEALAFNCPVVSTNCNSGPAEILENGKYGILTPVGNAHELAAGMEEIILNPEKARERTAAFQQNKLHEFTIETALTEYKKLLAI